MIPKKIREVWDEFIKNVDPDEMKKLADDHEQENTLF